LGKALGLETLWFKEGGIRRTPELMEAYDGLARETIQSFEGRLPPTHVFLQAGSGDFAAFIAGHLSHTLEDGSPRIIVVEPANADCVLESVLASRPIPDSGAMETNMEALAVREVSPFAWGVLKEAADAFLSISDYAAEATVELLKKGVAGDPAIITRPSGAAGLAGLIAASFEPALTEPLNLGPGSRVLVLGWEGPA
jgi:threonine dehydratase